MPLGGFLDSWPKWLFIAVHIIFLGVGAWAAMKASKHNVKYASAFWLYVISQVGFLAFFGGYFTLKMAVLLEQTLLVIMVIWIVTKFQETESS